MKKIGFALFASLLLIGAAVAYAQAQESNIPGGPTDAQVQASGITFPVAELGNCADKQACRQYCESPANVEVCVAFAEKQGLMNKEEAQRAKKFTKVLEKGGPGGCKTPKECESFCSDINNLEVCMKFAKDQGVKGRQIEQGEKVLKHMKAGGKTPGGCRSENDCKAYCSDFSRAEECFEFAKAAGIVQAKGDKARPASPPGRGGLGGDEDDIPSPEQFQKLTELSKSGQTPGGCKSKESCEAYCEAPGHMEACVAFAEKVGFMSSEEAQRVRKIGGKGPGGCSSPRACEEFCNNPANRETCFKFAEENGFISAEDKKRMQEGLVQMRAGIEHAPPEVTACLKSTVGPNVIDDIQSGKLMPGPEIGEKMRDCFEKFGQRGGPQDIFKNAPPEVAACLKEKLGSKLDAIKAGKEMPTPEMADTFRVCFQSVQFEHQFGDEGGGGGGFGPRGPEGSRGPQGQRGPGAMMGRPPAQALQDFMRTAPPQVQECLKQKLGDSFAKLQSSEPVEGFDPSMIRTCFESFRPDQQHFGPPPAGGAGDEGEEHMGPPPRGEGGEGGVPRSRVGFPGGQQLGPRGGSPEQGGQGQGQVRSRSGPGGGGPGLPENVLSCVKEKLGDAVDVEKLRRGERPSPEVEKAIAQCFPQRPQEGTQQGGEFPGRGMTASGTTPQSPHGQPFRGEGFPGQGKPFTGEFPRQGRDAFPGQGRPFMNASGTGTGEFRGEMHGKSEEMMRGRSFMDASGTPPRFDGKFPTSPEEIKQFEGQMRGQMQKQIQQQMQSKIEGEIRGEMMQREIQQGGARLPDGQGFNPFGGKSREGMGPGSGQGSAGGFGQGSFSPQGQPGFPPGSEGGKFMRGPGSGMGGSPPAAGEQFGPPPTGGAGGGGQGSSGGFGQGGFGPQPGQFGPPVGGGQGGQFGPPPGGGFSGGAGGQFEQRPPTGGFGPLGGGGGGGGGGFPPPPSGGQQPPSSSGGGGAAPGGPPAGGSPPPQSAAPHQSLLGIILSPFLNLIGR